MVDGFPTFDHSFDYDWVIKLYYSHIPSFLIYDFGDPKSRAEASEQVKFFGTMRFSIPHASVPAGYAMPTVGFRNRAFWYLLRIFVSD